MGPGGDPCKVMMEVDRPAADLHRLGDKSVTELRKWVIMVSGLSADFEMECCILENNPAGLNRAEIKRVVEKQYNILLRQQQDSKALSASKCTVTKNRGKGKNRKLHHKFGGNCFSCGKKGPRAGDCRSAKKKSEKCNPELPTTVRRAVAAVGATSAGVRSTLRTGTVVSARALSIGRETVRSAELKRAQCWQN